MTGLMILLLPYWLPMLIYKAGFWGLVFLLSSGRVQTYAFNQLISIDQHGASLLGFSPDVVISALVHVYDWWLFNLLRPILNRLEAGHTEKAWQAETCEDFGNIFWEAN